MSVETLTWAFKNSPYTGTTRLVHLAVADVANEDNDYGIWLSQASIAAKAKCSVMTVHRALDTMVKDGYLSLVKRGNGRGHASRYHFLMPAKGDQNEGEHLERERVTSKRERVTSKSPSPLTNSKELKERNPRAADAPQGSFDGLAPPPKKESQREADPIIGAAHQITERVFANRKPKPIPKFLNVRALAESALRAEYAPDDIESVMMRPDTVFTKAGFEMAVAKSLSKRRGRDDDIAAVAENWLAKRRAEPLHVPNENQAGGDVQ